MSETLGLKNINMLSKEMYSGLSDVATDELYAISGSGFGFPSDRYDDLELGASGTEYTAPANGYFCIAKNASSGQYIYFGVNTGISVQYWASASGYIQGFFPVMKGQNVELAYTASGTTAFFKFIYAEGE